MEEIRGIRAEIAELKKSPVLIDLNANPADQMEAFRKLQDAQNRLKTVKISDYSMESADEFMAEAFTQHRIGVGQNKYTDRVMEVLDREYRLDKLMKPVDKPAKAAKAGKIKSKGMDTPNIKAGNKTKNITKDDAEKAVESHFSNVLEYLRNNGVINKHKTHMQLFIENTTRVYDSTISVAITYDDVNDVLRYNKDIVAYLQADELFVVTHDISHRMDVLMYESWEDEKFKESIKLCASKLQSKKSEIESWFSEGGKYESHYALMDIFYSLFEGNINLPTKRDQGFFDVEERRFREIFADLSSLSVYVNSDINEACIAEIVQELWRIVK